MPRSAPDFRYRVLQVTSRCVQDCLQHLPGKRPWQAEDVLSRLQGFAVNAHGATARCSPMSDVDEGDGFIRMNKYLRSDSQSHSIVAASMAAHYLGLSPAGCRYLRGSVHAQTSVTVARMRRNRDAQGWGTSSMGCQNLTGFESVDK
jgi:hypothetical protein